MAKPIAIIYFPDNIWFGKDGHNWIYEYAGLLNGEKSDKMYFSQKDYWRDYYWFCFYKKNIDEVQIQVFYEKDFTDIQFEELRKLVLQNIEEQKHG